MKKRFCLLIFSTLFSPAAIAQEAPAQAVAVAPAVDAKPKSVMRGGMKFIPLDRKKTLVRPVKKTQPAIIRPRSPIVNRAPHHKKDSKEDSNENSVRIDNNNPDAAANAPSGNSILSVFPTGENKP